MGHNLAVILEVVYFPYEEHDRTIAIELSEQFLMLQVENTRPLFDHSFCAVAYVYLKLDRRHDISNTSTVWRFVSVNVHVSAL